MTRTIESLSPSEVLALAVQVEQANARRFRAFADVFRGYDPEVAARFEELASEEDEHEAMLRKRFQKDFGDTIPVIEEVEVEGVVESVDLDSGEHLIFDTLKPQEVYRLAHQAEVGAQEFYRRAAANANNARLVDLFRELADMEDEHAGWLEEKLEAAGGPGADR